MTDVNKNLEDTSLQMNIQLNVRIPFKVYQKIRKEAFDRHISLAEITRTALENYIKSIKK